MTSPAVTVRLVGGPFCGVRVRVASCTDTVEITYARRVRREGDEERLEIVRMDPDRVLVKGEEAFSAVYGRDEGDGVWRYLRREVGWR